MTPNPTAAEAARAALPCICREISIAPWNPEKDDHKPLCMGRYREAVAAALSAFAEAARCEEREAVRAHIHERHAAWQKQASYDDYGNMLHPDAVAALGYSVACCEFKEWLAIRARSSASAAAGRDET